MATDYRLKGLGVLVTRPAHQAQELCAAIRNEGGKPFEFPTLEILPMGDKTQLNRVIDQLKDCDIGIFTSVNAVTFGLEAIANNGTHIPSSLTLAVVGTSTAAVLEDSGLMISICPQKDFSSEGLLAEPAFCDVTGKRIIIFTGVGGRQLLADTLAQRGAEVVLAECYERCCPKGSADHLLAQWSHIDIVLSTSIESLNNLQVMLGDPGRSLLQATPLLVISQRMADYAQQQRHSCDIIMAESAQDKAIIDSLVAWYEGTNNVE